MPSGAREPSSTYQLTVAARLRVVAARWEAPGVTSYELARPDGGDLPTWEPGAHVDLHLPSGAVRQYSLCGDPADRSTYRIAVLEVPDGRGGSVEVHRELRPGIEVEIGVPRSNFALVDADRYVFVAGGIGITPLLPMVREVARRGRDWQLVYGARSSRSFAFADELRALDPTRVRFVAQDRDGFADLAAVAATSGAAVFCCGPAGLLETLAAEMAAAGRTGDLHLERFAPELRAPTHDGAATTFEVELAQTGLVVEVTPEQTVLEAVRAAGVDHPSSCEMGFCGTCETKVLAGQVDHRDDLLTPAEKAEGSTMMICVSRARCPRLLLDL